MTSVANFRTLPLGFRALGEGQLSAERRSVEVCADWLSAEPMRIGLLHATLARGKEVFAFEYDRAWLARAGTQTLDPALRLDPGPQFAAAGRTNFGLFLDSSPDRWGRVLLQRREAQRARESSRAERRLVELDFLLGVYDGHRMGALRFRQPGGPFLDDDSELASPPWTSLRELEQASLELEHDQEGLGPRAGKWLRMLIAPGRSLGGARPKASVLDKKERLWIAKFPSERDHSDVGAWESIVARLALRAGVHMAESQRRRFGSRHHTFLTRRFDRTETGSRIHFASAMTLLEQNDGEAASYLDLARLIQQHGASPDGDLEQLWRRIAFFVCVSNVDDHLRNHGFLLGPQGFSLAPAYDINPVATAGGLTLNISETDNAQDLSLVKSVAKYFRLSSRRADEIVDEVVEVVRDWRKEAKAAGLARVAQDEMAPAFQLADPR